MKRPSKFFLAVLLLTVTAVSWGGLFIILGRGVFTRSVREPISPIRPCKEDSQANCWVVRIYKQPTHCLQITSPGEHRLIFGHVQYRAPVSIRSGSTRFPLRPALFCY